MNHKIDAAQLMSYFSAYSGPIAHLLREGATAVSDQECLDYVVWTLGMAGSLSRRKQADTEVENYLKECSPAERIAAVRAHFSAVSKLSQAARDFREIEERNLRGFGPINYTR